MTMTFRLFSAIPVLAAMSSGCSFSFDADLPEVEITQRGLTVPGVPQTTAASDLSVTSSFTLSSSDTAWAKDMNSDVLVHQVKIVASGSLPNLDFIQLARMTVAAPSISGAATDIMDYERGEEAPSSSVIEVSMSAPVDITTPWSADNTIIEVQIAGQLPGQDWTVDVTLTLSGKITYKF
jgi:hypothetical protein